MLDVIAFLPLGFSQGALFWAVLIAGCVAIRRTG